MSAFGLGHAALAAIVAAASIAVIALYFFKLRRRRVLVASLPLWERLLAPRPSARLFAALRRLLSLLLSLGIALALGAALFDPQPGWLAREPRSTLILIDTGRSMSATDVAPTRLAQAQRLARALVDDRRGADELLVASFDRAPTARTTMTRDDPVLSRAIAALRATGERTDLTAALRFARAALSERPRPELVLISDGNAELDEQEARALARHGVSVRHLLVGRRSHNLAVAQLAARRYPRDRGLAEVFVRVHNGSPHDQNAVLTLLTDGAPTEQERVRLPAGAAVSRVYADVLRSQRTLQARVALADGSADDLPQDDVATLDLPAHAPTRVLCVTRGNRYLEAALLLDEHLLVDTVTPDRYTDARGYDVAIFDAFAPPSPAATASLYLGAAPLPAEGELERPYFEQIESSHPLLRMAALRDVNIARARRLVLADGDRALARAADGSPLMVIGERDGQPFLGLAFDLRASDLPLRVAFPVWLLHAIDYLAGRSDHADVRGTSADAAGPANAASLAPRALPFPRTPPARPAPGQPWPAEPWRWLVAAATAVLCVEWWSYHRRWTV